MPLNLMPRRQRLFSAVEQDVPPEGIFQLTPSEQQSDLWRKLKTELTKRLQTHREANDSQLAPDMTARLRGHIECLREIISIGDEPPTLDE